MKVPQIPDDILKPFAGRWVAILDQRVVSHGGTPAQALRFAKETRYKETPQLIFVPMNTAFDFPKVFYQVRNLFPKEKQIFLVGGAVRDSLLGLVVHDLDFVLHGNTRSVAKRVADSLGAALFALDEERGIIRVLYHPEKGKRIIFDFVPMQGKVIDDDLLARDFTINAMAVDVWQPHQLLDPLGGAQDLLKRRLRLCSSDALRDDPVRILRGIRFAAALRLNIPKQVRDKMRRETSKLRNTSSERIRDELFSIAQGERVAAAFRALDMLGGLTEILPELKDARRNAYQEMKLSQWELTLRMLNRLEEILGLLETEPALTKSDNFMYGLVSLKLGRFRQQLHRYWQRELILGRCVRGLVFLAGLLGSVGQKHGNQNEREMKLVSVKGKAKSRKAQLEDIGGRLKLSNEEINWLVKAISAREFLENAFQQGAALSKVDVYRYYKRMGEPGVAAGLLFLASQLAQSGGVLPQDVWARQVSLVRVLWEAWWEHYEEVVSPPKIITGAVLISRFDLEQSPLIGDLLEKVREGQVRGDINTREEALRYVHRVLSGNK